MITGADSLKEKENVSELRSRKENNGKEEETKESELKEKSQKKKKKKSAPFIREGYGILLKVKKNWNNDEIIINKFIGNWKNNQKNGLGFQIFSNKNCFYGTFQNNFINGWGHFQWNNGSQFEGTWKNNVITDIGTYKNNKMLYEGYFYDNKFVNWDGSWIHLFEAKNEEDNKSSKEIGGKNKNSLNLVSLEKDIRVVILPFDFVKRNLKNISDLVQQDFNATPFFLCSYEFLKENKNFSLAHFVFLSFYLGTDEQLLENNQRFFYKSGFHEKSGNYKKQIYAEEKCTRECRSVEEETTSENSNELSEFSEPNESYNSKHVGKENETKGEWDYECADSKTCGKNNVEISNVHEYITNLCYLENQDTSSSDFTQFSEDWDETKREELNSLETEEKSFTNWTEKQKDEINKFITDYANLYIDTGDSSSNYSPVFSEYELEEEGEKKEEEEEEEEIAIDKSVKTITEIKKETEEIISEKNCALENKKGGKLVKSDCEIKHTFTSSEEIEKEIDKVKIDMTFLKNMRNLHIPCQNIIRAKIKNALYLKYPFFLHLNISEEDKINETIFSNRLLPNFDIPEFWNLRNIFGSEPFKLPTEIICPYHLERSAYFKRMLHSHTINKEFTKTETQKKEEEGSKMETNAHENTEVKQTDAMIPMFLKENICFDNLTPNTFILTDLVVDHIDDVTYLKHLIKDKFQNWGNLLDFFFIIIS